MITDHGRAHLAQLDNERAANRATMQAERDTVETDLSLIAVGCLVWLKAPDESDTPLRCGIVANADATHLWLVDDQRAALWVKGKRGRQWTQRRTAGLRRVAISDVERWEPVSSTAVHAAARALWLEAGARGGDVLAADTDLVDAGLNIVRELGRGRG